MKNTYRIALLGLIALMGFTPDAAAQRRAGSIYQPNQGPFVLVGDRTARRPGDLVTIVISENQDVRNEETSDLSTQKGLDYQLTAFDLKPNMFSTLPSVQSGTEDSFSGSANYEMPPRHAPQPSRSRQALGNSQPSPEMISVQKPRQRCVPANAHGGALPLAADSASRLTEDSPRTLRRDILSPAKVKLS